MLPCPPTPLPPPFVMYSSQAVEEPRCVRTKYGAWYLPVSMWKPRPADEVWTLSKSNQNVQCFLDWVSCPPNHVIVTFMALLLSFVDWVQVTWDSRYATFNWLGMLIRFQCWEIGEIGEIRDSSTSLPWACYNNYKGLLKANFPHCNANGSRHSCMVLVVCLCRVYNNYSIDVL